MLMNIIAATAHATNNACNVGASTKGGGFCDTGLPKIGANSANLANLLAVVFGILGALAVLFVVIGGFRYVESQGDPQAAAKARSTILYAVIGLVLAILSEAIVALVLGKL